jgi:hypothetical protein
MRLVAMKSSKGKKGAASNRTPEVAFLKMGIIRLSWGPAK